MAVFVFLLNKIINIQSDTEAVVYVTKARSCHYKAVTGPPAAVKTVAGPLAGHGKWWQVSQEVPLRCHCHDLACCLSKKQVPGWKNASGNARKADLIEWSQVH